MPQTNSAICIGERRITGASKDTPLRRFGQPDDIARLAVFLASDQAARVTGMRITDSGGFQ
ncbi:SDR family NAD(P)-dependent oxidoreductase [Paracoccus alkanivorans]|uniref:SDR family NAD(P)-dependent oxidoreductase n=1 Tax=Paracoccus alkanivorans TaxID=2116655 RepID=A0A3M0M4J7_9RHOB|nr:SDR family NAD(P)-dependent oxidoreductase [Paracoccus alkanivorans]